MVETDRAVAFVMDDILLREPGRRLEGAGRLRDLQGRVLQARALRHHAAQGRSGAFKKVVDAATAALYTGGEGQKIYDKWFTQKIPPKGLNLNMPIASELKNEFAKPSDSPGSGFV